MKKITSKVLVFGMILAVLCGFSGLTRVYADEEDEAAESTSSGTSISLSPVSKVFQLSSESVYDSSFNVTNDGDSEINIEVYAAPYSYVYSNEEDLYKLGFNNENNFTQISRWITFETENGTYAEKAFFTIAAKEEKVINYRVITPPNIPSGGQYAVIFAHTLSSTTSANGIKTEASPGMVIYGRSTEGEINTTVKISNLEIKQSVTDDENNVRNNFYASAKIKNEGNIDIGATGVLKVEPIIGGSEYETPASSGRISVIPEAELILSDEWRETPSFGLYKVTWTVTVGDQTESIEKIIFLISPLAIIISMIFLTFITIWIIIVVRRRKERHSRLAI